MTRIFALLVMASLLAGCASSGRHAPVIERGSSAGKHGVKSSSVTRKHPADKDGRPKVYVVQKGDTLFGIAFNYGLDYHELAELNGIQDPNMIQVGQQISLFPGNAVASNAVAGNTVAGNTVTSTESRQVQPVAKVNPLVKDQPMLVKYPYSEAAVAKAESVQADAPARVASRVEARPEPDAKPAVKPDAKPDSKPDAKSASKVASADSSDDDALEWSMPAQGKLIGRFSESENRKGIDIAGKLGQPVYASAPGKVVYSGSGLRGYGKLLIIKHNKTYLSAYAHNDQLLVKEGETVTRGQKIAEMGSSDSNGVMLHFEVRRFGKPVDPADYLALGTP